jgi:tetratricopeptide (TPR) repeat protein
VLRDQGKYEAAEEMHQRALELKERVLGPEHPSTLTSMYNLAGVLRDQGKYEAAEEMHRRALELCERVLGPEHPG